MKNIDFGKVKVALDEVAAQGNAILGIRGSGKTHTGTYMGERMLDAGIPIVVFDPIGIWRYLRVPAVPGNKSYKVVVAGGEHGDIPLTATGAAEIMRAAMKEGVSLVFDLYDIRLSKADWRRVVESALKVLLYENKPFGLRHIFMEEAAEFCPQRISDGQGAVYDAVERLARMGGNAQLGYTLINQRAEQVNKAVLELCDMLVLHRQKGRNSLMALAKWLDVGQAKSSVAKEVPALQNGEAFIWPAADAEPVKTKIPAKQTFHPDRRAMQAPEVIQAKEADVAAFVAGMKGTLETLVKEAEANDPKVLRKEVADLRAQLATAKRTPDVIQTAYTLADVEKADQDGYERGRGNGFNAGFRKAMEPFVGIVPQLHEALTHASIVSAILKPMRDRIEAAPLLEQTADLPLPKRLATPAPRPSNPAPAPLRATMPAEGITSAQQRILDSAAFLADTLGTESPDVVQLALFAGQSASGGYWRANIGRLRTAGLMQGTSLTPAGRASARPSEITTVEQLHAHVFANILQSAQKPILRALIDAYPEELDAAELGRRCNLDPAGGYWRASIGRLRSLGLITKQRGPIAALPVLFLEKQ